MTKQILANTSPSQSSQKNEIQDAIDRLKKRESERQQENTSWAVKKLQWRNERENQDNLQRNCAAGGLHTKMLAKDPYPGHFQERWQRDAGNYRPICTLPVLYKLFAAVLYARFAPSLHKVQPPDQAGFRPNHRCDDHLMVYRILEQRCREWGCTAVHQHDRLHESIRPNQTFGVMELSAVLRCQPAYVRLLQRLYSHKEGTVLTDKESDTFPIKRGTEQGDPLSSLLFNTVLQYSLENDLKRWQKKQKGIRLSDKPEDCLTNQRFAYDVLLFSTSLKKLREMLREFKSSTEAVGLGIHPDKTKILSNQDKVKVKEITVDNIKIEVLEKGDSARYLGHKITFEEQETEEIKNRLKAAWAAFHKYRQELTSKDYRLCHRLRLFQKVITPTLTYANGTWTLSQKHEKMIKTAQRKMLRLIVQTKRKYKSKKDVSNKKGEVTDKHADEESMGVTDKETEEGSDQNSNKDQGSDVSFQEDAEEEIDAAENEEDWIEYIKRSTKEAEEHTEKQKIPCRIEIHRRLKWRMVRRISFPTWKKVDQRSFRLASLTWQQH